MLWLGVGRAVADLTQADGDNHVTETGYPIWETEEIREGKRE
jgi:hypothetical protein